MSEHGCISDINSKNIQCEKILIKNGSQELLSTTTDNKLLLSTDIIPQDGVINLGSEDAPISGLYLSSNTIVMVTDGDGPNLTIGASKGDNDSAPSLNIGTDDSNTTASLTVEKIPNNLTIGENDSNTLTINSNTTVNNNTTFIGTTIAPTVPTSTNNTEIATTAFVKSNINELIDSAPETLNTLNELSAALNDDENFGTTILNSLNLKAPIDNPTFTGIITGNVTGDVTGKVSDISNHSINGLSDVDTTTVEPEDGQILAWDNNNNEWKPKDDNIIEVIDFGLGVVKPGSSFKINGISENNMFYYTNNGSVFNTSPPITVSNDAINYLVNNDLSNNNEFTFGYQDNTIIVSDDYPVYLIYDALEPIVLMNYKMWPRKNEQNFPLKWKLEASDEESFSAPIELDSQDISSSYIANTNELPNYTDIPLENTPYGGKVNRYLNKYRYYRLNITSGISNNKEVSIGELVFYKKADEPSSLHAGHLLKINNNGTGLELTRNIDITGDVTGKVSDISNHNTDSLGEGTLNKYFTNSRSRSAISVNDTGGDGALSYDSTTGQITYIGPSATETRSHFSGGTGVSITNGAISIGQQVGTSDNVTFNELNIVGNSVIGEDSTDTMTVKSETSFLSTVNFDTGTLNNLNVTDNITISGTSSNVGLIINNTNSDTSNDPTITLQSDSVTKYVMGIDRNDNDKFKIGTTSVDTNTRFSIDTSGNVGIGTNDPISSLQIQVPESKDATDASNFDHYGMIISKVGTPSNGTETGLCFDIQSGADPENTRGPGAAITHERTGSWSQGKLHFKTNQSNAEDADCVTAMTIAETGNVGIGNTSPIYKLDVNGTINSTTLKTNNIIESYDSSTITYIVTVANKTSTHPYYNDSGSSSAYFINGIESPYIDFVPGKTYRFDQSDISNSTHPLRFYYEKDKTNLYTTGVTINGTQGSTGAYTEIVVTTSTPRTLFYQCTAHLLMGNQVQIKGGNIDVLSGGTGNTTYTDGELLIGNSSGNTLSKGTLTAGTGISITNGNGSIEIENTVINTDTTYSTSFVDDSNDAILRLTAGGSGSGTDDLKFIAGSNITLTPSGNELTIASTASGSALTVQDEGNSLTTAATTLNFVGSGVTASGTGTEKTITITGGGSGSTLTVQDEGTDLSTAATTLNFVGSGVSASGSGSTKTITITGGGSIGLLETPTPENAGQIVTVNAAGDDLVYGPKALKNNMNYKNIYDTGSFSITASDDANSNPAVHPLMNITITPQLPTSKVMITVNMIGEIPGQEYNTIAYLRRTVNGVVTDILPPADGIKNRGLGQFVLSLNGNDNESFEVCNFHYIDEPNTTSEVRYDVLIVNSTNTTFYYNRTIADNQYDSHERGMSFISAEEKFANDDDAVGAITSFTQEQALAGAGGTAAFTAYGLYGNNATDVITTYGNSAGQYYNSLTTITELPNNDITYDVAIRLESPTTPVGLSYEFTTPQIVTKYRIWMHGSDSTALEKSPKNWEFRASVDKSTYNSNDSSTYTVLDSRNDVTSYPYITGNNGNTASANLHLANEYNLSSIGAYKYYILHITSTNSSTINVVSVSEVALYGGGFTIPSQIGNSGKILKTNGTALEWSAPPDALLATPTVENAGQIVTVNAAGDDLVYSGHLKEKNYKYKMLTGRNRLTIPARPTNTHHTIGNGAVLFNDGTDNLDVTITPSSETSEILISANIMGEFGDNGTSHHKGFFTLQKTQNGVSSLIYPSTFNSYLASANISWHDDSNSTVETGTFRYVDKLTSSSPVTYCIVVATEIDGYTEYFYTNGCKNTGTTVPYERGLSIISAEELGGNAITSFKQEQALAGAGGTAAFTAYVSSEYSTNSDWVKENLHDNEIYGPTNGWASNNTAGTGYSAFSSGIGEAEVAYEFTTHQIITKYRLWPRYYDDGSRSQNIRIWELRGANDRLSYNKDDSTTYTVLDSQSLPGTIDGTVNGSLVGWPTASTSYFTSATTTASNFPNLANEYKLSKIGAYKYYVLHITGNYGASLVAIFEWALYGGGFTLPSQVGNAGKILKTDGIALEWDDLSINNLSDVDTSTNAPTEGQALVYDDTAGNWKPGTVATSGGSTVTAHTDTQTGSEDYLSALTVEGTKYKIGTNVSQVSYSDSSKLLLSYPFAAAANATDAQTNYGSFDSNNITTSFSYDSFTPNQYVTVRNDSNNNISFVSTNGNFNNSGDNFTMYLRWRKTGNVLGEKYARLISAWNGNTSDTLTRLQVNFEENVDNSLGQPDNNLMFWFGDDTSQQPIFIPTITLDRWYNMFIVVDNTNSVARCYVDRYNPGHLDSDGWVIDRSSVSSYSFDRVSLGRYVSYQTTNDYEFDGDFSDFYVFNTALSLSDAQRFTDYVENGYVNPGFPAPLKFLADVSDTTPSDGQALVYDISSSQWKPGTVATSGGSSTLAGLTDVSIPTTPSDGQALVWDYTNSEWKAGTITGSGSGTTVVANPTLSGNESNLTSLTIGSTNYKIPDTIDMKGDNVIGEDANNYLVVNSETNFNSKATFNSQIIFNSQSTFNSQINMGASIIPTTNSQFDIGSAEYKVRHLYLSNNSIYMANESNTDENTFTKISLASDGELQVGDNKLAKLDLQGRLPNDKMPEGLLDSSGKISNDKMPEGLLDSTGRINSSKMPDGFLDSNGRISNAKMPDGLLDSNSKISNTNMPDGFLDGNDRINNTKMPYGFLDNSGRINNTKMPEGFLDSNNRINTNKMPDGFLDTNGRINTNKMPDGFLDTNGRINTNKMPEEFLDTNGRINNTKMPRNVFNRISEILASNVEEGQIVLLKEGLDTQGEGSKIYVKIDDSFVSITNFDNNKMITPEYNVITHEIISNINPVYTVSFADEYPDSIPSSFNLIVNLPTSNITDDGNIKILTLNSTATIQLDRTNKTINFTASETEENLVLTLTSTDNENNNIINKTININIINNFTPYWTTQPNETYELIINHNNTLNIDFDAVDPEGVTVQYNIYPVSSTSTTVLEEIENTDEYIITYNSGTSITLDRINKTITYVSSDVNPDEITINLAATDGLNVLSQNINFSSFFNLPPNWKVEPNNEYLFNIYDSVQSIEATFDAEDPEEVALTFDITATENDTGNSGTNTTDDGTTKVITFASGATITLNRDSKTLTYASTVIEHIIVVLTATDNNVNNLSKTISFTAVDNSPPYWSTEPSSSYQLNISHITSMEVPFAAVDPEGVTITYDISGTEYSSGNNPTNTTDDGNLKTLTFASGGTITLDRANTKLIFNASASEHVNITLTNTDNFYVISKIIEFQTVNIPIEIVVGGTVTHDASIGTIYQSHSDATSAFNKDCRGPSFGNTRTQIIYEYNTPKIITKYNITSRNDDSYNRSIVRPYPLYWGLYATNDDTVGTLATSDHTGWIQLDYQANNHTSRVYYSEGYTWTTNHGATIELTNTNQYKYYKLDIIVWRDGGVYGRGYLGEWVMWGY